MAYAQLVHLLELAHDVADDGTAAQELVARMYGPDEVHLRLLAHLGKVAEHVLSEPTVLLLLGRDGGGVGILPHLGVVGVALCTEHVGVHLVAHHIAHQVLLHLHAIGVAIVALHETAVLLVGTVVDGGVLQCALHLLLQHLLQRGQGAEHGIGVLAKDGDTLGRNADGMAVELLAHHYPGLGKSELLKCPGLHLLAASHGTEAHADGTLCSATEDGLHAMCLEQRGKAVFGDVIDGAFA